MNCAEVMCGSAVWSDGMETLNWHSDRFDIALNPDHDLMNEGFVLSVETKLRQKVWRFQGAEEYRNGALRACVCE